MTKLFKDKQNKKIIIAACVLAIVAIAAAIAIDVVRDKETMNNCIIETRIKDNVTNYFAEKETVKIDCFGDSITYSSNGITYDQCSITYPGKLEEKLLEKFNSDGKTYKVKNIDVNNLGIPGDWILSDSYKRLSGDADIVIMLYGINNVFQNQPYKGIIESNIDEIKKTGSELYLVLYPECQDSQYTELINKTNDYIRKVAKENGEKLIDPNIVLSKITNLNDFFVKDGIHFTPEGYEIFAQIIAENIYNDYRK